MIMWSWYLVASLLSLVSHGTTTTTTTTTTSTADTPPTAAAAAAGYNILLWASPIGVSHVHHFGLVGSILSGAGHRVTMVTYNEPAIPKSIVGTDVEWISMSDDAQRVLLEEVNTLEASVTWPSGGGDAGDRGGGEKMLAMWKQWMSTYCHDLFLDERRAETLRSRHFDVVIIDPFSGYCSLLYARHVLKLPYILYDTSTLYPMLAHFFDIPSPLSYVPAAETGFSDRMSFKERLMNVFLHHLMLHQWMYELFIWPSDDAVERARGEGVGGGVAGEVTGTTAEAIRASSLLIVNTDIALEYSRPTASNLVYVGGITCNTSAAASPDELPEEYLSVIEVSGDAGIIVFSMGTVVDPQFVPESAVDAFLDAFEQLEQMVIWRWEGDIPAHRIPQNVIISRWIPQPALLGHPKTRMFIGHGGLNGVMEVIYHGVPMLGIPMFLYGDQSDNLAKLRNHGAALVLNKEDVTADNLLGSINELLTNSSYKSNMMRQSRILRDQPQSPKDRLVFWVEYIIRHGGAPHLKSAAAGELNWFQYFLLDVVALVAAVILLLLAAVCKIFSLAYRVICSKKQRDKNIKVKKS